MMIVDAAGDSSNQQIGKETLLGMFKESDPQVRELWGNTDSASLKLRSPAGYGYPVELDA